MDTIIPIRETDTFIHWLDRLDDRVAKARIVTRLKFAGFGNLGDVRTIGAGISEMRVDVGPGYRVYFTRRGRVIVVLCGGDKSSQQRDIARARAIADELE